MMMVRERSDYHQEFLPWGYQELTIEAAAEGLPPMDRHALHVWHCGDYMLFALPNIDGSLCGVCTLPFEGPYSFESLAGAEDVERMFRTHFADVLPFMPDAVAEFQSRPISEFVTIRTSRWHHKGKILLIGDSAHSVVPFYGQGMNAAFEDCTVLNRLIDCRGTGDWKALLADFQDLRKPNPDMRAQLSVDAVPPALGTALHDALPRHHAICRGSGAPPAPGAPRPLVGPRPRGVSLNVRLRTALARFARTAAAEGRQEIVVQTVAVPLLSCPVSSLLRTLRTR